MDKETRSKAFMVKPKRVITAIVLIFAFILTFLGGFFARLLFKSELSGTASTLLDIIEQVGYVYDTETGEERKLTEEDVADALVNGLLDEYSTYYTQKEYDALIKKDGGEQSGVGVVFGDNDLKVTRVVYGSPAESAGVMTGDILLGAKIYGDTDFTLFTTYSDIASFFNTVSVGTQLILKVDRQSIVVEIPVTHSTYLESYVQYADNQTGYNFKNVNGGLVGQFDNEKRIAKLTDDTAYISLSSFKEKAVEQMKEVLTIMQNRGKTKLILDLRDNGGGYMSVLCEIASFLINNDGNQKTLIAQSKGKSGENNYYTKSNQFFTNISKIAVLADNGTASASECLIGAMLFYGDGFSKNTLIIEESESGKTTTFGKGIMQTTYKLITGGAFKLTTAKIYWPDKATCIHGVGISTTNENVVKKNSVLSIAIERLG